MAQLMSLYAGPFFYEPLVAGSHLGVCLACGALGQLVLLADDVLMSPYLHRLAPVLQVQEQIVWWYSA